jgi:hypothetical protein
MLWMKKIWWPFVYEKYYVKHYVRNLNRRHRSETRANVIVSNLEKWDVPASSRSGTDSVEGKMRWSSFWCISVKFISETHPLLWQKRDACSYCASLIIQVNGAHIYRNASPFIIKAGASPILSPITKAHASLFITKAGVSPIPYIEDER